MSAWPLTSSRAGLSPRSPQDLPVGVLTALPGGGYRAFCCEDGAIRSDAFVVSRQFHITRDIKNTKTALQVPPTSLRGTFLASIWPQIRHQISLRPPWDKRDKLLKT